MREVNANEFQKLSDNGYTVIDTRDSLVFCDGFIEGSVSVPYNDFFLEVLQNVVESPQKLAIVSEGSHIKAISNILKASGLVNDVVFLSGGYASWNNQIDLIIPVDLDEFQIDYNFDEFYLVDCRDTASFEAEHVEHAENVITDEAEKLSIDMENNGNYYVYGNSLSEAVTCASLLKRNGLSNVRVVNASFNDLKTTKLPFEKAKSTTQQKPSTD